MAETTFHLDGSICDVLERPSLDLKEVSTGDRVELDLFCDEDCLTPLRLVLEVQSAAIGDEWALFTVVDANVSPEVHEMLARAKFRNPGLVGSIVSIDSAVTWRGTSMSMASPNVVTRSRDVILNFERGSTETVDRMIPQVGDYRHVQTER